MLYLKIKQSDGGFSVSNYVNNNIDINSVLLELVKKGIISNEEAVVLKKIYRMVEKYYSYDDLKEAEDKYYSNFSCFTKLDRINLEIKYLKSKLHRVYKESSNNGEIRTKITFAILKLNDLTKNIQSNSDESNLDGCIKEIITLETEFDIEIRFLSEAHKYLQSKILVLSNGENKNG